VRRRHSHLGVARTTITSMGFGASFYGFFVAAAVWLLVYFLWAFKAAARDRGRLLRDRVRRLDLGLLPHQHRRGLSRRRTDDRSVGRRRGARGDADQRRHVRRDARPPLP